MSDLDNLVRGYVDAALWADLMVGEGDDMELGSEAYTYDLGDLEIGLLDRITASCRTFFAICGPDLYEYCALVRINPNDPDDPMAYAGHDLWLTRRGHGTGFWDRGLGELGERLTKAAKAMGEPFGGALPYVNEDGRIDV